MILRNYRDPAGVVSHWLGAPMHEGRSLALLMAGCALICVSVVPNVVVNGTAGPTEARIGAAIFAWLFIAPLAFYLIAIVVQLIRRALGRPGSGYETRLVLFWTVLAAAPLWLLNGAGMVMPIRAVTLTFGFIAFTGFFLLAIQNFRAMTRALAPAP